MPKLLKYEPLKFSQGSSKRLSSSLCSAAGVWGQCRSMSLPFSGLVRGRLLSLSNGNSESVTHGSPESLPGE